MLLTDTEKGLLNKLIGIEVLHIESLYFNLFLELGYDFEVRTKLTSFANVIIWDCKTTNNSNIHLIKSLDYFYNDIIIEIENSKIIKATYKK